MDTSTVALSQQVTRVFLLQVVAPVLVAVAAYVLTWQLGEWRSRRRHSKLGVVIIEMLEEELNTGIAIMEKIEAAVNDSSISQPPPHIVQMLPTRSWSSPQTIPDEVLLRIIETCRGKPEDQLPVKACRTHCKNYFDHVCTNYNHAAQAAVKALEAGNDWKRPFNVILGRPQRSHLEGAYFVRRLLGDARRQLEANAKHWFPK